MSDEVKAPPPTPEFGAYDYTQYQDEQGHYRIPSLREELSALFKPTADAGKSVWNQATKPESWTRQRLADSRRLLVEKGDALAKLVQDPQAGFDKFASAAASTRDFLNFVSQPPVVPTPPGALTQQPKLANTMQVTPGSSEPIPRSFIRQNELADAELRKLHAKFLDKYPTFDLRPLPTKKEFNNLATSADERAYYTALARRKQVFEQIVGLEQAYHRRAHETLSVDSIIGEGVFAMAAIRWLKGKRVPMVGAVDDALDAIASAMARKTVDLPEVVAEGVTAVGAGLGSFGLRWYQCQHDFTTMQLEVEALDRQSSTDFRL